MKTGIEIIAEERKRQIEVEEWTPEEDDLYTDRKSTRLNSSHTRPSRMPSSA